MKKVSLKNILLYCILTFLFLHNVEGANRNMNKSKNIEIVNVPENMADPSFVDHFN